jgi:hypothetical protein
MGGLATGRARARAQNRRQGASAGLRGSVAPPTSCAHRGRSNTTSLEILAGAASFTGCK